ncbi:MAG: NusA-like transcription termination signal-binding factor [Candidatus Aenigmatarchaeota archaeon]
MTIVLDNDAIRFLNLFENMTNVPVKDCYINGDSVYFIVEEGKIGLAIGKGGSSIRNVENAIGRKVKVYEYSSNPVEFVRNLIPQSREVTLINNGNTVEVQIKVDKSDRGFVIGREGEKIKIYKEILKRVHNISDIKVK